MIRVVCLSALMCLFVRGAHAQKIDSYLGEMGEALVPFGTLSAPNCHRIEIDLSGPWADYAIPTGVESERPGHLKWGILPINILRLYVDLADLNEDKVMNQAIFSLEYVKNHREGTAYVADTPAVLLETSGLNAFMIVHAVDLDRVHRLEGQKSASESDMGVYVDQRRLVMLTFSDQQHADVFYSAVRKAAILCKAQ